MIDNEFVLKITFEDIKSRKSKNKRINSLFIAVIYFPLSIQMNILTLYNNCDVILTSYMLDSALEPSYSLSKNLLLLPWILELIVDMVNDSTPLMNSTNGQI